MAVKTKKKTRAKRAKKAKTLAVKKAAKKAGAKNPPAKKTAKKKAVAKKSPAKKTTEQPKQGERKPARKSVRKSANKRVAKTPTEKTAWKISPEISQSAFTIDTWKNGDLLKVYRSGWIIVDKLPDLGGYNPDEGINIFEEFEFGDHQLYGGSEETSLLPNELTPEERERLLALSEEELADEGWTLESVTRFKGPLLVEQV